MIIITLHAHNKGMQINFLSSSRFFNNFAQCFYGEILMLSKKIGHFRLINYNDRLEKQNLFLTLSPEVVLDFEFEKFI